MRYIAWILLVASAAAFAQRDFTKVEIKVTKVAGSVYMLEGSGGRIGVSVGDDGIVIVDDQYAPLAEKIQAALKGITDKPVKFVINTHWHFDHTGGNAYFQKQGPVLAHENVRARMKSGGTFQGSEIKPSEPEALPIITFSERATLHLNGEEIRALHVANAHTDGDAIVYFTRSNVVHLGDILFTPGGFPFVDPDSGGTVRGVIAACEKVVAAFPADAKVIAGHGPVSTVADLAPFVAMLKESVARLEKGIRDGKTAEQLKAEKVLGGYESWGEKIIKTDAFIDALYGELSAGRK